MWSLEFLGNDFYHIFYFFIIYSFLGWLWEVFYVFLTTDKLVNRGFINGPLCPIYGAGALSVYLFLSPVVDNTFLLYFGGMIFATLIEYFTGTLMETIFHSSWWDYSDKKFNIKGRICLQVSLGWGLLSVIMMRVLHPAVYNVIEKIPYRAGVYLGMLIIVYVSCDFAVTAYNVAKFNKKLEKISSARNELRARLENTRLYETKEELISKLGLSQNEYIEELREKFERLKESGEEKRAYIEALYNGFQEDLKEKHDELEQELVEHKYSIEDGIKEHKGAIEENIETILKQNEKIYKNMFEELKSKHEKYESMLKERNYIEKRLIKAFPKIKSVKNKETLEEIIRKLNKK